MNNQPFLLHKLRIIFFTTNVTLNNNNYFLYFYSCMFLILFTFSVQYNYCCFERTLSLPLSLSSTWRSVTLKKRLQQGFFPDSFTRFIGTEDLRGPCAGFCCWILTGIIRKSKNSPWQQWQWKKRYFTANLCGIIVFFLLPLDISNQQN